MKVVINACYGVFSLSRKVFERLGLEWDGYGYLFDTGIKRNDPRLISIVEELGSELASGELAKLRVVEIPDDAEWQIEEYDGYEHVAEKHRTWS